MAYRSLIRFARPLLPVAAGCLATALLLTGPVGCSDPNAERQAKFEKDLNAVAAEYSSMLGMREDLLAGNPTDESLAALRALAERAKGLSGGLPAQEASARALAASIYRSTAVLGLGRAGGIEAQHEAKRSLAIAAEGLADDLDALAEAASDLDLSGARTEAQGLKSEASESARALQGMVAKLESPLNATTARMSEASARLSALDQENAVLLRKARESNPEVALTFVEEAAKVQGEARATRTAIGNDFITGADLTSQKKLAEVSLGGQQNLQAAATAAIDLLGQFEGDVRSSAQKTTEMAKSLRAQADELLKSIADERAGTLRSTYDAAAGDLANSSSGASASTTAMSDELRLQMRELEGIGAHGRTLLALKGDGAAGVAEAKAAAEVLIASIKEKTNAAVEQLANAGEDASTSPAAAFFGDLKKRTDGLSADKLMTPPAAVERPKTAAKKPSGSTGRSMSGEATASGGIVDLDAWIKQMNDLTAQGEYEAVADAVTAATDTSTDTGRAMGEMSSRMMRAMAPISKAMMEKFGSAAVPLEALGNAGSLGVGMMSIKSNDGEIASVGGAGTDELVFRKSGGVWKIDYVEALRRRGLSDEQMAAMGPAITMMGNQMAASMEKAFKEVADGVRAGQYASPEEVVKAMLEKIMNMAGAMGGGAGRGGFGGLGN